MIKKLLFLFVVFSLSIMGCRVSAMPITSRPPERITTPPLDINWDDYTLFKECLVESEHHILDEMTGASIYHLDVQIPGDFKQVTGYEEVRYTNQEDVALDEVYFRLYANISGGESVVSNVQVDGQEVTPDYLVEDSVLRVPLAAPLMPGESVVISMNFTVTIPREMGGNYGLFGYFDNVLVLDEAYPVIAVYDDEGWNIELPPHAGDVTHLDASFYLVRVTAPETYVVIASGVEVGHEYESDRQILTFASGPSRDFYIASSDRYAVNSQVMGETTINSYAFPEHSEGGSLALERAVAALVTYNQRFGPYPYTELDVVATPMQALGMEYSGLIAISLNLYDPAGMVSGLPALIIQESTVAHEVAHQWFYNTVGNDQVDEPWVDEAVVQYVTGLYYVDVQGVSAAGSYRASWSQRLERVDDPDIPIGLPVGEYEGAEYGAIVYGRGPLFVTALAEEIGQDTFDSFMRRYYETYKWDIASGEGFKQLAEAECDCDLTPLFEKWVYPE